MHMIAQLRSTYWQCVCFLPALAAPKRAAPVMNTADRQIASPRKGPLRAVTAHSPHGSGSSGDACDRGSQSDLQRMIYRSTLLANKKVICSAVEDEAGLC